MLKRKGKAMPQKDQGQVEDHFGRPIQHAEHLTWVDHLKAGFQPSGEQANYLQNQAYMRKKMADDEARSRGSASVD